MGEPILRLEGIGKAFGPVQVLADISLAVAPGEVLGILGENGAGKSTLLKIISGIYTPSAGAIHLDGQAFRALDPITARRHGVAMIPQEFNLVPTLRVYGPAPPGRRRALPRRRARHHPLTQRGPCPRPGLPLGGPPGQGAAARLTVLSANSGTAQVSNVEDLMIRDLDALVILPYNPGLGEQAARYMAEELNGQGNILVLEGPPIPINSQRVDAFNRVMADYPGINILASQNTDWNPQRALSVTEDLLGSNPEVDAIWAGDDDVLVAALQAIEENGRDDIQLIVGGGGSQRVIEMIRDDHPMVKGTVTYPPNMIASAIALAVHGVKGERLGDMYHGVPSRLIQAADLITADNVEAYYQPDAAY